MTGTDKSLIARRVAKIGSSLFEVANLRISWPKIRVRINKSTCRESEHSIQMESW